MSESNKNHNLKIFFIKLISISLAIVFIINILFNLIVADKFKSLGLVLSIDELETRRELGNKIRDDIEQIQRLILDYSAVTLCGSVQPWGRMLTAWARQNGSGNSFLIGLY